MVTWWRESDGDVADGLVDALRDLVPSGVVWLLTPRVGQQDFVDATDIGEGAVTAGLSLTSAVSVSDTWQATRLLRPKGARR